MPDLKKPLKQSTEAERKAHRALIQKIAREKQIELAKIQSKGAMQPKRGIVYYSVIIIGLMILGGAVLTVSGRGGKARIEKSRIQVDKSMDNLAIALGRYKFHVGAYPTAQEGLEALAAITPGKAGWKGPYIKKVVNDPWGHPYVYDGVRSDGSPIFYSAGPDGRKGTNDDVLPRFEFLEEPFRDTTWTNHWVPYQLRGTVVAPDEATKRKIQEEVKQY